jgi:hypothetical protein
MATRFLLALGLATIFSQSEPPTRAQITQDQQPVFAARLSLVDFIIVQRALMPLQDDRARMALENLSRQILAQMR